jgi:hypothetical protein
VEGGSGGEEEGGEEGEENFHGEAGELVLISVLRASLRVGKRGGWFDGMRRSPVQLGNEGRWPWLAALTPARVAGKMEGK